MPKNSESDLKQVRDANRAAEIAYSNMLAAFAQLQLDVQTTHAKNWDSLSTRQLEDKIEEFRVACVAHRHAQDGIIRAMSLGSDRPKDTPSPEDMLADGVSKAITPPAGWKYAKDSVTGIDVLVPDSAEKNEQ